MKKKILFCSEASYLNTGYATYSREIIRRLHASGKYEVAEFASYGKDGDPRIWFYGLKKYCSPENLIMVDGKTYEKYKGKIINKKPGNNSLNGASLKNNHPKANEKIIPKY